MPVTVKDMKIAVLISGGVDSSVALNLLKDQGHEVTAFYLKIWLEEDFSAFGDTCPWEEDLVYIREICEKSGVPLFIVPMQEEYWKVVVAYTLSEVKAGRTPNPDIFCNKLIKFGVFLDKFGDQFDKIATGHYAQIQEIDFDGVKIFNLKCAPDEIKDQTYFLSYLNQKQLSKLIFPVGNFKKSQVRDLAQKYDLPNKDRKDSQGICFLGKFKFDDFLKHYVGVKKGDQIEFETGKKLGEHNGFWFHTIGQRRGSGLAGGPWYVVDKDVDKNIVYLSKNYYSPDKVRDTFEVEKVNWISDFAPEQKNLQVKMRHGKNIFKCEISFLENGNVTVKLDNSDQGIASGQFAVFYYGDVCLGGGVIKAK
ncbi:MAG: tRNA-specific 2-thiouridylase MnmA [candidate division TM6 bacterium GW2011_GWF2_30_66]|nr:MAG: tRNA-specific 2-thiouridylase MnmA [candidate division TM6 bacterium GW2011_GWF2_30_66]